MRQSLAEEADPDAAGTWDPSDPSDPSMLGEFKWFVDGMWMGFRWFAWKKTWMIFSKWGYPKVDDFFKGKLPV